MYDKPFTCLHDGEEFDELPRLCSGCDRPDVFHTSETRRFWEEAFKDAQEKHEAIAERRYRESFPVHLKEYQLQKQVHEFWNR